MGMAGVKVVTKEEEATITVVASDRVEIKGQPLALAGIRISSKTANTRLVTTGITTRANSCLARTRARVADQLKLSSPCPMGGLANPEAVDKGRISRTATTNLSSIQTSEYVFLLSVPFVLQCSKI